MDCTSTPTTVVMKAKPAHWGTVIEGAAIHHVGWQNSA
jgi:hypothetical protein